MNAAEPHFSVIIPLMDERATGSACLESWLGQIYPQSRYEIVLVTPTPNGDWERSLLAKLRPQDCCLGPVAANETTLWDYGARQAAGQWLFFTEAHCLADARCLDNMATFLEANHVVGACCRSAGITDSAMARMDERLFHDGFEQAIRPDNWRKLSMHGCALDRRIFLELGGFDGSLGRFGEWVLQQRLHQSGHRLGYADRALVRHVYRSSLLDTIPEFASYTAGECAFRAAHPQERLNDYSCWPTEWRDGFDGNTALARRVAADLLQNLPRGRQRLSAKWARLRDAAPSLFRLGLLSNRLRAGAAWTAMHWALLQSWQRRRDEAELAPAYRRFKEAIVRWTRFRCLARQSPPPSPTLSVGRRAVADLADEALVGFHCLEHSTQGPFRWTRAVAGMEFHLTPGDYRLRLRTGGLRRGVRTVLLDVFFNRTRIPQSEIGAEDDDLILPLAAGRFQAHDPQRLVLVCQPEYPGRSGSPDRRELGVPVVSGANFAARSAARCDSGAVRGNYCDSSPSSSRGARRLLWRSSNLSSSSRGGRRRRGRSS